MRHTRLPDSHKIGTSLKSAFIKDDIKFMNIDYALKKGCFQ